MDDKREFVSTASELLLRLVDLIEGQLLLFHLVEQTAVLHHIITKKTLLPLLRLDQEFVSPWHRYHV